MLYAGRNRRKYSAHLEIARNTRTADSTIRALCSLIDALPKPERSLWNTASVRTFSVGIQAGGKPNPCDFVIRPGTVDAVSALRAQIVFTVYPPETYPTRTVQAAPCAERGEKSVAT